MPYREPASPGHLPVPQSGWRRTWSCFRCFLFGHHDWTLWEQQPGHMQFFPGVCLRERRRKCRLCDAGDVDLRGCRECAEKHHDEHHDEHGHYIDDTGYI